jgi:hypothetical protein
VPNEALKQSFVMHTDRGRTYNTRSVRGIVSTIGIANKVTLCTLLDVSTDYEGGGFDS